ncbi:MAG: Holliday junction resolvase RuvX [Alphaproteobacteria bacterium]|nr:Holliday junction resolvase RuvX [Alphaproteobacteria bacterium]
MGSSKETDLAGLRASLKPGARLLGLDVGSKTLGVAVSDGALSTATPVTTLRRGKVSVDAAALKSLAEERRVGGLVLGLPVNMDGSEGPACQSVRQFARNLAPHLDLPYAFWDERLSTAAVTRQLLEADVSRAKRARAVDALAAVYILQGALDRLHHGP